MKQIESGNIFVNIHVYLMDQSIIIVKYHYVRKISSRFSGINWKVICRMVFPISYQMFRIGNRTAILKKVSDSIWNIKGSSKKQFWNKELSRNNKINFIQNKRIVFLFDQFSNLFRYYKTFCSYCIISFFVTFICIICAGFHLFAF